MHKRNILISAFAVCPPLPDGKIHPGSEYSCAWNLIKAIDETDQFNLTILIGSSDRKFGSYENLNYVNLKNTEFVKVSQNSLGKVILKLLEYLRINPEYWLIWPFLLKQWNKAAFKKAILLCSQKKFDLVHQASPGGFKNPGYLWKLNIPSYWGPVYGLYYLDPRMALNQSFIYFLKCILANILNFLTFRMRYVSQAAKYYDYICTGTTEAQEKFSNVYSRKTKIIYENALNNLDEIQQNINSKDKSSYEILWCGSIDYRKNLRLFLDSLCDISTESIVAHIAGDGPNFQIMKDYYEEHIKNNTIADVIFHGHISQDKLFKIMQNAHVLVFTTMADANTSAIFEALARGLIPITVDGHGFRSSLSYKNGILVNVNNEYDKISRDFRDAIEKLQDFSSREIYYQNIIQNAYKISWEEMIERHKNIYFK
tara:strand:- start:15648 stop:16928 length:1281 start_codon:yes stop_codon:yes gene_type:complete